MIEYYNDTMNYNIRTNCTQSNVSVMDFTNSYYIIGGYSDNKFNFTNTII